MLTPFLLGAHPNLVASFYTTKAIILISARFIMYKKLNWHYFLFDFCYFANLCLLGYLHFFPNTPMLFMLVFGMANGPLGWAVPIWRNSMVFHSIDKVTSVLIHIGPPIVTYAVRWNKDIHYPNHTICPDNNCDVPYYYLTVLPLIPYTIWQVLYWVYVIVMSGHKDRMTSFRWILEGEKSLARSVSCAPFGEKHGRFGFFFMQYLFTILTLIPMKLMWDNQIYHLCYVVFITLVAIWNGANYYFDVFSKKYIESLQIQEQKLVDLKDKLKKNTDSK